MTTKPIERYLFAQGDTCFFCNDPLLIADATVEHLLASSRGGSNGDDNCVACCKSINTLLGNMSLKEKFKVVLNRKGNFKCPNKAVPKPSAPPQPKAKQPAAPKRRDPASLLVANLKARPTGRPTTLKALTADIKSQQLGRTDAEVGELIERLKTQGKLIVTGTKVTYKL